MDDTQDKITKPEKPAEPAAKARAPLADLAAKRAENLRANLMKRKQQARARSEDKSET